MGNNQASKPPIISYGPCQFPTLGFIVQRAWEIYAHVPETFWSIHLTHIASAAPPPAQQGPGSGSRQVPMGAHAHGRGGRGGRGVPCEFQWQRKRVFDVGVARALHAPCALPGTEAAVESIDERPTYKYPPHPLSTIEFAKKASSYLRIGSHQAMKIAEDLYQTGFISYPRTETDVFSPDFDLRAIAEQHTTHPQWGAYAQRLVQSDPSGGGLWRAPRGGGHDDKAHPPIHPTKFTAGEAGWDDRKRKVYELVVRTFLACCSERAVGSERVVRLDCGGEKFHTRGLAIILRNYLDVYPYHSWNAATLPALEVGMRFVPDAVELRQAQTRPPERLKETDLIALMERHGIGTDATMAQHIDTILKRG